MIARWVNIYQYWLDRATSLLFLGSSDRAMASSISADDTVLTTGFASAAAFPSDDEKTAAAFLVTSNPINQ